MTAQVCTALALAALALAALALAAGCKLGPDYERPAPLAAAADLPPSFAETGTGELWKPAAPQDALQKGPWWQLFGDPELDRLEAEVLAANQELAAALHAFERARAFVDVARGGLFPQLDTAASARRQHDSANLPAGGKPDQTYTNLRLSFDLGYEIDLWGRVRRTTEAATATAAAAAADLANVQLALQAEAAADHFALGTLDAEIALLEAGLATYRRALELVQQRRKGGLVGDLDVATAETVLRSAEVELTAAQRQRAQVAHALATLTGRPASAALAPRPGLPEPIAVPPGLPAELLERRPDVAAAERRMAAANAAIGIATAAFYPAIRLGAAAGLHSGQLADLFDTPSQFWALGPGVTLPLFAGGRLQAELRAAGAGYDAAVARYRQTVLVAFEEVENHLAAQRLLALEQQQAAAALAAARRQLEIADHRYRAGLVGYLEVATAQQQALQRERAVVRLRGQRLVTAVALIKALGGGWGSAPDHRD
jgi:multidrug efflux system outer membrane protein